MKITKWGFGTAPFKEETESKYRKALVQVRNYIDGNGDIDNAANAMLEQAKNNPELLSEGITNPIEVE